MSTITFLGPQRLAPNLAPAIDGLDALDPSAPVVAITAGWQEREQEDDELRGHLGRDVVNLRLHERSEEVFAEDSELFEAHRARQNELRAVQRLYRFRLDYVIEPARRLLERHEGPARWLTAERRAAIGALRVLDRLHARRMRSIHDAFESRYAPLERPAVVVHREAIRKAIDGSAAVAIAGGHVAVLLNRMRLFGVAAMVGTKPLFAWSAGAMACAERVVAFHDSPPQGAGNAEVLELGLGLVPGVVPLPHASRRLHLDDATRVALMARRFAPSVCLPLDEGSHLRFDGRDWWASEPHRRLGKSGRLDRFPSREMP